MKKFNNIQFI